MKTTISPPQYHREAHALLVRGAFNVQHRQPTRDPLRRARSEVTLIVSGPWPDKHRPQLTVNKSVWDAALTIARKSGFVCRSDSVEAGDARLFSSILREALDRAGPKASWPLSALMKDEKALEELHAVIRFFEAGRRVIITERAL